MKTVFFHENEVPWSDRYDATKEMESQEAWSSAVAAIIANAPKVWGLTKSRIEVRAEENKIELRVVTEYTTPETKSNG